MSTTAAPGSKSILELAISPNAPIYHLKPDPLFQTVDSFLALSAYVPSESLASNGPITLREGDAVPPSMARRSRQIREGGNFSYTSPLPLEFPYDLQAVEEYLQQKKGLELIGEKQEKIVGKEVQATAISIETCLAELEPSLQYPVYPAGSSEKNQRPTAFSSPLRDSALFPSSSLLSFSHRAAAELLPQLDVGEVGSETRQQFIDVVTGKTVLARTGVEGAESAVERQGFAPWACCYGGHQFGGWAGQLGDGRAISILSTPTTPEVREKTGMNQIEIALKGSGRTPYSRFADGLAVLRSSIREYLGSESMAALGLPTSRALALVGIPSVKVRREKIEGAAIVTRLSGSWIRIGNFEILWSRDEWESLRGLSNYVATKVLNLEITEGSQALEVVRETSKRTAVMIAGWQAYGFCHGVMNTDNMSIDGKCIDYGPFAFQDVYSAGHICNHSDGEGRYKFSNQPTIGLFAISKLSNSLAELIGAELASGTNQVGEDWADVNPTEMEKFRVTGLSKCDEVKKEFQDIFTKEYTRLMRLRFGLVTEDFGDFDLFARFMSLMELYALDFSTTIRLLSQFPSTTSPLFPEYLEMILPTSLVPPELRIHGNVAFKSWFSQYEDRLNIITERRAEELESSTRKERMNLVNPRFILRQWVLEFTIAAVDQEKDLVVLERVLEMCSEPFKSYGEEILGEKGLVCAVGEELERVKLCGMGDSKLLGFQCSCSS